MTTMSQRKSSTHYIAALIRHARRIGLDVERIITETGIPPELAEVEDQWIENDLVTSLVKKLWSETNNETFGLDPTPLRIGTWAIACEFMLAAETLGDLYRKGERILSYLAPQSASLKLIHEGDTVSVLPMAYIGESDPDHFLIEFMTVLWHRFPCWAIDENIPLQRAFFSFEQPGHGLFYEEIFHCDVSFQQPANGFSFNRKYLQKPIVRSMTELNSWLRDSPADLLYMPGRETSIGAQIKAELRRSLKDRMRFPAFERICGDLAMSVQVVRRRLADEGTSYQQIKDAVRRDRALELLSNPEISIADIAERTGFTEAAAFSRAFKKWTDLSPAQFRAEQQRRK
jgi:AraC-like DNA-binding protein